VQSKGDDGVKRKQITTIILDFVWGLGGLEFVLGKVILGLGGVSNYANMFGDWSLWVFPMQGCWYFQFCLDLLGDWNLFPMEGCWCLNCANLLSDWNL